MVWTTCASACVRPAKVVDDNDRLLTERNIGFQTFPYAPGIQIFYWKKKTDAYGLRLTMWKVSVFQTNRRLIMTLTRRERRRHPMTRIKRGFRICLYRNDAQKQQIAVSFGCSRWLWNNMLAMQKERHDNEPSAPYLSAFSMNYLIKQLKREYPWLKDADSTALTGTPENLHDAYTRFFKGQTRFPKFKSKKHEQSYISKCVNNNIVIINNHHIRITKLSSVYFKCD